jgi:hypothetical protein
LTMTVEGGCFEGRSALLGVIAIVLILLYLFYVGQPSAERFSFKIMPVMPRKKSSPYIVPAVNKFI